MLDRFHQLALEVSTLMALSIYSYERKVNCKKHASLFLEGDGLAAWWYGTARLCDSN
jgi:hypothetical protein